MITVHIFTGLAAAASLFGYVCRMDALHFREHRASVVLLHLGLAVLCLFGLLSAWEQETDIRDVVGVCVSGLWLLISAHSWANGVPSYFLRSRTLAAVHTLDDRAIRVLARRDQ